PPVGVFGPPAGPDAEGERLAPGGRPLRDLLARALRISRRHPPRSALPAKPGPPASGSRHPSALAGRRTNGRRVCCGFSGAALGRTDAVSVRPSDCSRGPPVPTDASHRGPGFPARGPAPDRELAVMWKDAGGLE